MGDEAKTEVSSKRPAFTDAEMEAFRIGGDFKRKFAALGQAGRIRFDWNGHHKRRMTVPTYPPSYTYEFRTKFGVEESVMDGLAFLHGDVDAAKKLLATFDAPGSEWLPFHKCTYTMGCYNCGKDVELLFNGINVKAATKCKYPDGHPPIKVKIDVPSGKLVFANGFSEEDVPLARDSRAVGVPDMAYMTKHYAKHNVAYGACGNSCPGIWINEKRDRIVMGNAAQTDEYEDLPNSFPGYKRVGSVITDLWAWAATCADNAKTFDNSHIVATIKVIPGSYRVSQMFHLVDYDNHKVPHRFATIERIGR